MSSRAFQNLIMQMKDVSDVALGVIDHEGTVIASSELSQIGEKWPDAAARLRASSEPLMVYDGRTFKQLSGWSSRFDFAVFVSGVGELARNSCNLASVALNNAKAYFEERHDKAAFVKNVIFYNILAGDIYVRAKELGFPADVPRAAFLVRQIGKPDIAAIDMISDLFPDKQKDFVINVSETDIAVIKEVPAGADNKALQKIAVAIQERMGTEMGIKTIIGIGSVANHLRDLADAFKKAQVAIEVGKVFDTEKTIINYDNLGIGRLIYQLPTTLCEIFLSEVFKKNPIDSLDAETLFTINKFFENNLNVSETSRKLFVHRNTLVYRLDKIKKLTGLDLREFDHAIVFKVALMVKKYLISHEAKN
ncbi:MAG: PucR family transcriptional regulator [Oscillospiraceae bacterium]|jgi:carbohydrate diacid regulator